MRILIVHNLLWAHYKASVFEALQQIVDQQPDVTLKVLQLARNERSRAGMETDQAAPVYRYTYELLFDRFLEDVPVVERTRTLLRRVAAFKPDVINLTGYYDPAQVAVLLWARARGIPVVMQNESTTADNRRGGWKETLKRRIIGLCSGFFCFGNRSADYLLSLGVPAHKILLRKNAVDNRTIRQVYDQALPTRPIRQQQLGLPPNNFIYIGRLIGIKNLPTLLDAFAQARQLASAAPAWGLVLLGDGADRPALLEQIARLGLADVVSIQAPMPWYRVPELMALSNVLVLPSLSEPWGLVVNEAMVCGLPVLVSNQCGCVPDLVDDGQTGFVFDPNDVTALAGHMADFMNNRVDVPAMRAAVERRIAPYAPEAVAREMLAGFRKVTA
ncbi:hypothetical protein GCM10027578_20440 [Spirosoma luteolum]